MGFSSSSVSNLRKRFDLVVNDARDWEDVRQSVVCMTHPNQLMNEHEAEADLGHHADLEKSVDATETENNAQVVRRRRTK